MVKNIDPFEDDDKKDDSEVRLLNEGANEGIRWELFTKNKDKGKETDNENE